MNNCAVFYYLKTCRVFCIFYVYDILSVCARMRGAAYDLTNDFNRYDVCFPNGLYSVLAVCRSGNGVGRINEVAPRRSRLT